MITEQLKTEIQLTFLRTCQSLITKPHNKIDLIQSAQYETDERVLNTTKRFATSSLSEENQRYVAALFECTYLAVIKSYKEHPKCSEIGLYINSLLDTEPKQYFCCDLDNSTLQKQLSKNINKRLSDVTFTNSISAVGFYAKPLMVAATAAAVGLAAFKTLS